GTPASTGTTMRILEQVGFFGGLGIVIVLLAAMVAGRVTAVPGVPAAATRRGDDVVPATRESADESETEVIS
ncbi:MAG TPA: hypothetical protein VGD91_00660, partial [Trebonia sp.]